MDYEKLGKLNNNIKGASNNYLSMIAVGSIVTGDPYIEGRSDKDIVLIFDNNPTLELSILKKAIHDIDFDESYLFTPIPKNYFGVPNSKYTFSNKFRSRTLFGNDFVESAILPDKKKTKEIYTSGLVNVSHQLYNQLINSSLQPLEKVRDKFWKQFKHSFMNLAIREYYLTEDYPRTRKEICDRLGSEKLDKVFNILHSIDEIKRCHIMNCGENLLDYLQSID